MRWLCDWRAECSLLQRNMNYRKEGVALFITNIHTCWKFKVNEFGNARESSWVKMSRKTHKNNRVIDAYYCHTITEKMWMMLFKSQLQVFQKDRKWYGWGSSITSTSVGRQNLPSMALSGNSWPCLTDRFLLQKVEESTRVSNNLHLILINREDLVK